MVVELKLSKSPEGKFGFRLVGGADFEIPLTVSLVIEGSIADEVGLQEGDVVIRINKTTVVSLTHEEAHKVLSGAGNEIVLSVLRGDDITPLGPSPCPTVSSPVEQAEEFRFDPAFQRDTSSIISDQEIAEVISGEAEVLRDHNVMGIDFQNKMHPQSGVFKQSEVFRTLQEETRKTKEDIEAEQKRWTTFLQKPNRPIPTPKNAETRRSTYKPPIIKQSKPLVDPEIQEKLRSVSPSPFCGTAHIPLARTTASPEPKYLEEKPTENTEEGIVESNNAENAGEENAEPTSETTAQENGTSDENTTKIESNTQSEPVTEPTVESAKSASVNNGPQLHGKTPEEQEELLRQLSQVQKQIEALQALPSTIQATLDALTSQLSQLLQPPKEPTPPPPKEATPPKVEEPEEIIIEEVVQSNDDEEVVIPEDPNAVHLGPHTEEEFEEVQHEFEEHEEDWQRKSEKPAPQRAEGDTPAPGAWNIKTARAEFETNDEIQRTGDVQKDLQEELKKALKRNPQKRVKKAAFGPLTPMERPIFLKGRIWKSPKDAFNEDFIAETISSQAELIIGSTLGQAYESPSLGYDQRVNFLKYQKPEKDLSFLKNSETFKLLHGLDGRKPVGIENRPEKVAAAEDVERALTPCP